MVDYSHSIDLGKELEKEKEKESRKKELEKPKRAKKPEPKVTKAFDFFKKYQVALFIFIVLFCGFYVRLYAAGLPGTEHKELYQDENGDTYLLGIDPYYYFRQAENIIDYGHVGDTLKDGKPYDTLRPIPYGAGEVSSLLPYLEVYFYKTLQFFDKDITLLKSVFYLPVFLALLCIVLIFFVARKLSNNWGGFFASFLFALNPRFFVASRAGFTDTNVLNIFFSLLVVLIFLKAIDFKDKKKSVFLFASLIPAILLFKFAWSGYYYIIFIILSFIAAWLFITYLYKAVKKKSKNSIAILVLIVILSLIAFYFVKKSYIWDHVLSRLGLITTASFFPTGFSSVSELQPLSFSLFISLLGGKLLFLFSIAAIIYLLYRLKKKFLSKETKYNLFAIIWFVLMLIVSLLAVRFSQYFVIIFCVVVGIGLARIFPYLPKFFSSLGLKSTKLLKIISVVIILLLLVFAVFGQLRARTHDLPIMDDSIYNSGIAIKNNSSED
ncbi:hypothetical protein KY339_01350, partial [Candidatus Woesearchaeota archaeon]|nr:hypothetical protein [Candidatus Woesearchaeota archaeon]